MEMQPQTIMDIAKSLAGKPAMQSQTIGSLAKALAAAQAELQPATKNSQNPFLKNKYADITAVYTAIRSVLPAHGLAVTQTMIPTERGFVAVRTTLIHESGEWIAGEISLPCLPEKIRDKATGKTITGDIGPQQYGSAITYARRYSLSAIIGVVSEDDDDAEAAQKAHRQKPQAQPKPQQASKRDALCKILAQQFGSPQACLDELSLFFTRSIKSTAELSDDEVDACLKEYSNKESA